MSAEKQTAETLYAWVKDGGLAGWIESVMNDENKLRQIEEIYQEIIEIFDL